jgi:hypothetical protein
MSARSFWPPVEPAQIDYEALRIHVLDHDDLPDDLAAARFARRGLAGLIDRPVSDPVFLAELIGAARPAWSAHGDPRLEALAAGYAFLLDAATARPAPSLLVPGGAR